jgi:type II secretory pathway pseudopilin PulG
MKCGRRTVSNFFVDHISGMSLPEVMVSVAITSVVGYLAFGLITDFNQRAWEHEAKSRALDERELAANIIKRELPQFINSVTGPYGETRPASSTWTCTSASCRMEIDYQYSDINGNSDSRPLIPIEAKCVDITDTRLANSDVKLNEKAKGTLGFPKCIECPPGKAPQVSVKMYRFDANTGAPSVTGFRTFPRDVGKMSTQGSLAMGICVDWPSYQYNAGMGLNVNRYDRWEVTLIPVYPRLAQRGGMKPKEIEQSLQSTPSKILISPSKRLGPELRLTPVK